MNPRILISGCNENRILYETAITQCGGIAVSHYLPPLDESCDGLLLCGGNDVSPKFYGQENTDCHELDEKRDEIELQLIKIYAEAHKPILGICRGQQILNVAFGGDLYQDIGEVQRFFHCNWEGPADKIHPIRIQDGTIMNGLYRKWATVNTYHHQAIHHLGNGLKAAAWSESGIIEAIEHESLPILGVQWHPERMSFLRRRADTVDGASVFRWFLAAAGKNDMTW